MTAYTGMVYSYTDTTAQVRCIEDAIHNVSPDEVPLTKLLGINSIKDPPVQSTTYEWLEEELAPTSTTLNGAIADTTTTTCAVYTGAGNSIRVGTLLAIGDELVRVSGVSTDTLTISRGWASTTAATALDGAAVKIAGFALIEGADAVASFTMDVGTGYNYTQIFQDTVQVTGTQGAMKQYGKANEFSHQMGRKFTEQAILLELALFLSRRSARSSGVPGTFGGLKTFITNNITDLSSAAITEKNVMDTLQSIFDDVGSAHRANLIVCNGWVKRKITSFYAPYARQDRAERAGGVVVDVLDTEFGKIDIMLNTRCPASWVWFLNTKMIQIGPMQGRAFFKQDLAIAGDYRKSQIVGEYTVKVLNDRCHGLLYNASTST